MLLGYHKDNVGMSQARLLSQFFTNPDVADESVLILFDYLESVGKNPRDMLYIEPSAGNGVFVDSLKKYGISSDQIIAIEVDPVLAKKRPEYILTNLEDGGFLGVTKKSLGISSIPNSNIVIVGNPPYSQPRWTGRSGIISLQFLNHAMEIGDTVAFILGTTFRRPKTHTKINHYFHIAYDDDINPRSFTMDGQPKKVATIFQIWERLPELREDDPILDVLKKGKWGGDWEYTKSTDPEANLRICHWGSHETVGRMSDPDQTAVIVERNILKHRERVESGKSLTNYDPDQSHFYIKALDPWTSYKKFLDRKYLFRQVANDRTMGQNPDLTRVDIVQIYTLPLGTQYLKGKFSGI